MLSLGGTKAVALTLMALLTLAVSILPLAIRRLARKYMNHGTTQKFMSACLCFGGGILLATVFLHLLPEVRSYLEVAMDTGLMPQISYPIAELIVCLGFYFIYMLEEVVHSCVHHHHHNPQSSNSGQLNKGESDNCRESYKLDGDTNDPSLEKFLPTNTNTDDAETQEAETKAISMLRTLVVVAALSIHSIMEGLAMGLVHQNKDVWILFAALSAHKLIIAFCMAMELLESGASKPSFFISMLIFSLASPIGGAIGALVVSYMTGATAAEILVPTILQGISAGTILYVTFCEILERERAKSEMGQVRMWSFLIGFLLMAGLQVVDSYYVDEENLEGLKSTVMPYLNDSSLVNVTETW